VFVSSPSLIKGFGDVKRTKAPTITPPASTP
jgi:hypothetical protein